MSPYIAKVSQKIHFPSFSKQTSGYNARTLFCEANIKLFSNNYCIFYYFPCYLCSMVIVRRLYNYKKHFGFLFSFFFFFFHRATVVENSQPVERNLPLSILMSSLPPTGADAQEQNKERLSTGTKFALRQWIKFLHPSPPGGFQGGDSSDTMFQGITKAGHQPVRSPFWGN